jgi:DnaJ-class molecular chaperone
MNLKDIEGKNFYEILGVVSTASAAQIKEVYRDLARVYHPDSNFYSEIVPAKVSPEEVQLFKIITAAYNTLTDEAQRAEYDRTLMPTIELKLRSWEDPDGDFWSFKPHSREEEIANRKGYPQHAGGGFGEAKPQTSGGGMSAFDRPQSVAEMLYPRKKSSPGPWIWGVLAVCVGLLAAGLIYLLAR